VKDAAQGIPKSSSISVVVPVYNSEPTLGQLVVRLEPVLRARAGAFEVVLVNDGSQDKSWQVICELAEQHSFVRGLDLMRNYGQHNALLAGIRTARHDIIVSMDDDLQHPPEEIPRLLDKLAEGYDVVYGTPQKEQHGLWRDMASMVSKMVLRSAVGSEEARSISAFRAFRRQVRDAFANYEGPSVFIDALLTWGTVRFGAIPVRYEARPAGTSSYTFRKLVVHALNMMTGFSTLPLKLASLIGFVFTLFGLVVLGFVVGSYLLYGGSMPGFPFLASVIAVFSGAQLFALGVMGEYLARMHFRSMGQPYSVVRSTVGFSPDREEDQS